MSPKSLKVPKTVFDRLSFPGSPAASENHEQQRVASVCCVASRDAFRSATDIAPIRGEKHYKKLVTTLEALLDETAGDERHAGMGLVDIVGDLIEDYEAENHSLTPGRGVPVILNPASVCAPNPP